MKAHIVGGGFGGLAAAACLILNAGVPGSDIVIYEASDQLGGGFFLSGDQTNGYNLPGSVFDDKFFCAFALLARIPSLRHPSQSVKDQFFAFNQAHPFNDCGHIVDGDGRVVTHNQGFGLAPLDLLSFLRLLMTPEAQLDGKRIDEFFSQSFFSTEFFLLYSTIMGPLPQHSAMEFRRYINRTALLLSSLYNMQKILRTPRDQYETFIEPMAVWLVQQNVAVEYRACVTNLRFAPSRKRLTVVALDYESAEVERSLPVADGDIVLVTLGSQIEGMCVGSKAAAPAGPSRNPSSVALWRKLAAAHPGLGDPDAFFDPSDVGDTRWVMFTVTTSSTIFQDLLAALTRSPTGTGGIVTLRDSRWLISLTVFHQPEVVDQDGGIWVWWGYGLHPEQKGAKFGKPMNQCTGAEILEEVVRELHFAQNLQAILDSSSCVPCDLPYVNNIWLPCERADRPDVVPYHATNLGLLGQYAETPQDIGFTMEYSARTAWEAVYRLLGRGPAPPPVFQATDDLPGLLAMLPELLTT
jgi:oleate hydratase